jgi:hypothetical protein
MTGGSTNMRVEVIYAPGCSSYRKAISILETVIAEERYPIPVESFECSSQGHGNPSIRINGVSHSSAGQHLENLRDLLSHKWKELNEHPLLGM